MQDFNEEPLGIPSSGFEYMKMTKENANWRERLDKFLDIRKFISDVVNTNTMPEFQGENKTVQFINYGDTELVFVFNVENRKYTLLVGQPATEFGEVETEYENLRRLGKCHKENIVVPIRYFSNGKDMELYVTPYLYQARCVGIEEKDWGMWVPEPQYYFQDFSQESRKIINSSMIAMLIKFFDDKNNLGIGACHIGGGDFVLQKGFEKEKITYENVLRNIKLIAARKLISASLDEYIDRIKQEFSRRTYYKTENQRDKSILINYKCKTPMTLEEIQKGIELGYKLRETQKNNVKLL